MTKLDKKSPLPLYRQLRDKLRDFLRENPESQKLPGELELAQKYGVSRNTVRNALKMLEKAGLIQRVPHRGTLNLNKIDVWDPVRSKLSIGMIFPAGNVLGKKSKEIIKQYYEEKNIPVNSYSYEWLDKDSEITTFNTAEKLNTALIYYPHYEVNNPLLMQKLLQTEKPIVLYDIYNDSWEGSCVCSDHFLSGCQAAKFLIGTGCRKCAIIMPSPPIISNTLRMAGFEQHMYTNNVEFVRLNFSGSIEETVNSLRRHEVDGIFFPCPGFGLVEYLLGHPSVLQNTAIAFFENRQMPSLGRKVFFISQDEVALGRAAVMCLQEQMSFPGLGHKRILVAPKGVIL